MAGEAQVHLSLDRDLRACHAKFESWRLGSGLCEPPHAIDLPSPVYAPELCDTDYVHACNSALHNALAPSAGGGSALFLKGPGGAAELHALSAECPPSLHRICSLPPGPELPLVEPALMPTVVEVASSDGAAGPRLLLASSGRGDLHLTPADGSSGAAAPSPVHPLRPHAPLQGVRPFQLLAAMRCGDGDGDGGGGGGGGAIVALVWAVARGAADRPSRCEVHELTLRERDGALDVADAQLLQRSAAPPFGALCDAASGGVLLAVDPLQDDADPEKCRLAECDDTEAGMNAEEEDGDDESPRTAAAAAAAARLAHLTSEELLTDVDLPRNQYADVFKESGPDGAGAMGGEPTCTLVALRWRAGAGLTPVNSVDCHPHRLLGFQKVPGDGERPPALRLVLTDDVDAAVIEAAAGGGSGGGGGGGQYVGDFWVRHVASVPALAYVAAGKLQRKFLLASGAAVGAGVAAALVEARQHVYLYRRVAAGQPHGEQAVVDTCLAGSGAGVAGAALAGGGRPRLLVLGSGRLLCYPLCE